MINLQQTRGIFRLSDNFGLPVCPLDHVGEPGGAEQCPALRGEHEARFFAGLVESCLLFQHLNSGCHS